MDLSDLQHAEGERDDGDQLRLLEGRLGPGQPFRQQRLQDREEAVLVQMRQDAFAKFIHVRAKGLATRLGEYQPHV